jgi:hypothetical protein
MANELATRDSNEVVKQALATGKEAASIQNFLEASCPGIVFDNTKTIMPQLKLWVQAQNPGWSKKEVKLEAERKMRKEFRPYTDALLAHIQREYDLELPKFAKPTKKGIVNGGTIGFKRKTSVGITQEEINAKLESGDPDFLAALARAGYDVEKKEQKPAVREVESTLG